MLLPLKLDEGCELCDDETHQEFLYEHYESCPRTIDGQQGNFVAGQIIAMYTYCIII